jgi:hypothetical protein
MKCRFGDLGEMLLGETWFGEMSLGKMLLGETSFGKRTPYPLVHCAKHCQGNWVAN